MSFSFQFDLPAAPPSSSSLSSTTPAPSEEHPSSSSPSASTTTPLPSARLLTFPTTVLHNAGAASAASAAVASLPPSRLVHIGVGEPMHVVESTAGVMDTEKVPDGVDLVPGYYEGGLKVWESSIDLVRYLRGGGGGDREDGWDGAAANVIQAQHRVLELGCGHGLPGIEALQQGAAAVCFMDLNEEVLIGVTSPNIALNIVTPGTGRTHQEGGLLATVQGKVTLVSGDWEEASPLLPTSSTITTTTTTTEMQASPCSSFDVILTAETIYTTQVTQKLLEMIQRHLTKAGGVALVAGKRYYFGTGGSVIDLVSRAEGLGFQTRVVESIKDGKSNIRDLVELKWK